MSTDKDGLQNIAVRSASLQLSRLVSYHHNLFLPLWFASIHDTG